MALSKLPDPLLLTAADQETGPLLLLLAVLSVGASTDADADGPQSDSNELCPIRLLVSLMTEVPSSLLDRLLAGWRGEAVLESEDGCLERLRCFSPAAESSSVLIVGGSAPLLLAAAVGGDRMQLADAAAVL